MEPIAQLGPPNVCGPPQSAVTVFRLFLDFQISRILQPGGSLFGVAEFDGNHIVAYHVDHENRTANPIQLRPGVELIIEFHHVDEIVGVGCRVLTASALHQFFCVGSSGQLLLVPGWRS